MPSFTISGNATVGQLITGNEVGLVTYSGSLLTTSTSVQIDAATLYNQGFIGSGATALLLTGTSAIVTNYGDISGYGSGASVISTFGNTGSFMNLYLTNYGTIAGSGAGTSAVYLQTGGLRLVNTGEMTSMSAQVMLLRDLNGGSIGFRIENSGSIIAGPIVTYSIDIANDDDDTIVNTGEIFGSVTTGGGFDTVTNSGRVTGDIYLGAGNDVFNGRGGYVTGTIYGGADSDTYIVDDARLRIFEGTGVVGTDTVEAYCDITLADGIEVLQLRLGTRGTGNVIDNTINGNAAANALDGEAGNDVLTGLAGNDSLVGDTGDDSLNGGSSEDVIWGGVGKDTLVGGYDDDRLYGGSENDRIFGNFGDDLIQGGRGKDSMTGGDDADTFVFASAADAGNGAQGDVITDFTSGTDHIDLSGIDANTATSTNNAFTIVAAFTGAAGQLILRASGGNTFVEGDVNGNGTADFSIQLTGVTGVLAADLIV